MPNKVFISYRREDSRYQARRVYDAFVHALPPDTVFMDVDSIPPGADFVEILEGWVQQCDILLALIGPTWLKSIDPRTKRRRLDSSEDFVRIEVRGALQRKIPVVPVLLDAAEMPTAAELPDDIKALRRRHAEFVDFRTFDADVQRLIKRLKIDREIERSGEVPGLQAGYNVVRGTVVAAVKPFFQSIKSDAVAAKPPLLAAAVAALLLVGAAAYVISVWPHVDAPAGLADFAKSEEGRRTAEARASQATDALTIAVKARQEAEAAATAAAAAQAKSEESRRTAEARAGEAGDALTKAEKARQEAEAKATAAATALAKTEDNRRAAEARANDAADALKKSDKARLDAEARATSAAAAQAKAEEGRRAAETRPGEGGDTLTKAEKARQEAEAKATAAAAALVKTEENRRAAEARANDAADALKKSDKARLDAEARATSAAAAQATAEEGQRTAVKARSTADAAATAATIARIQIDTARQGAETRASAATEALAKTEKARQEAEARVAALTKAEELRKIADARPPSPAPPQPAIRPTSDSPSPSSRRLLANLGSKSRWALGGAVNCNFPKDANFLSLEVGSNSIIWTNGLGSLDVETIVASYENAFHTSTSTSSHVSGPNEKTGQQWAYSRNGDGMVAQPFGGRSALVLTRCP
jgi:hypothetical protein